MSIELHLPDLPEVPITLGPVRGAPPRVRAPWHLRLRHLLSAYLPLLLMALLALATWWLVRHSPQPPGVAEDRPVSMDPDYTMERFSLQRFDADGRLKLRVEGDRLRHFPGSNRTEVDEVRIRAIAVDGRVTLARAHRALGNGDGSEMQLIGGAEVDSVDTLGNPLHMRGEFLHAFFVTERISSYKPVTVSLGSTVIHAAALDYDHPSGRLDLKGPTRAEIAPRAGR
jgi:lipopolysaccharide export system protein LptC